MRTILILLFIFGTSQSASTKKDATNHTPINLEHQGEDIIVINDKNETIPSGTDVTEIPIQPTDAPITSSSIKPPITTPTSTTTTATSPPSPPTPPTPTSTTSVSPTNSTTTSVPPTNSSTTSTSTVEPTSPTTKPTPAPTPSPSTTSKPVEPTTAVPEHHRRFDGPSFIGGIVLALGLVAIGFVAFKFYKARTELNYHTL